MYLHFKYWVDFCFSLILIVLLFPLLFLISIIIKISDGGPVFFIQSRLGYNGNLFNIIKFRTMIIDAPDIRRNDGTTYNSKSDTRVTKVGRILRETSMDELPQLFNILKGEMSLIGPRPELPDSLLTHTEFELSRLFVRPGLTGLAQIKGRNLVDIRKRRALDVEYQSRLNFLLDVKIFFITFCMLFRLRSVYSREDS